MKCLFHNDNDGRLSAYLVANHCDRNQMPYEAKDFIEINYDKPFPADTIADGETVWLLDYSIPTETMQALLDRSVKVIWIDHHISAIKKYEGFDLSAVEGIRDTRYAACVLTYMFLKHLSVDNFILSDIPRVIQLVNDWDTWTHILPGTKEFQSGSELYCLSPVIPDNQFGLWRECLKYGHIADEVIDQGSLILRYKRSNAMEYLFTFGFETTFEGHKCFALNVGRGGKNWFDSLPRQYPLMACFVFTGEKWTVSLYTNLDTINVSEIAALHGGGGHPGAAGFTCDELPFRKVNE